MVLKIFFIDDFNLGMATPRKKHSFTCLLRLFGVNVHCCSYIFVPGMSATQITFLFLFTSAVTFAQTEVRYYKNEALTRETNQKKAKFISTTTTEGGVVTNTVTYPSGTIRFRESYKGDEPVGIWLLPSGELLNYDFELQYKPNSGQSEQSASETADTVSSKTSQVLSGVLPSYSNNGESDMIKFVVKNIRYPRSAKENNFTGVVNVIFTVEKDGSVSNVCCYKRVHPMLDKEAIRVIKMLRFDEPGYQDDKPVRTSMTIPVRYSLR